MSLRNFLTRLENQGKLTSINHEISTTFEISGVLKKFEPGSVFFSNIKESQFTAAGNLYCSKETIADYFGQNVRKIVPFLVHAIENPTAPVRVTWAACQEVIMPAPDLDTLPILHHCAEDGGKYISSGVVIAAHPDYGQNLDFHRCMQISKSELAIRVVKNRHFDHFLKDQKSMEVAICIGVYPSVMLAAATSVDLGCDELSIANSLEPLQIVKAVSVDLWVPADCEFVIEGIIQRNRMHPEGPFVDLTGTYDIVREQPIFEVKTITRRNDPIWHALLPGGLEHKLLMGMPREPTIFKEVNKVVKCLDVNITPGGASWLHAVVQIEKQHENDGKAAILAAFAGHKSCKHVFVVDQDIDIYDPHQVEWAMATRFQGDRDLVILDPQQGSSLDPSANPKNHLTTKMGFDLTKPIGIKSARYERASFPDIDANHFLSQ